MEWNYLEPDFLDEFVKYIGYSCKFSATLIPNIPEFLDAFLNYKYPNLNEISLEIRDKLVPKGQKLSEDQIRILSLFSLCRKHDIYPFWALSFDDGGAPEIKYFGPKEEWASINHPENAVYKRCLKSSQFSKQKKWYQICFKDFMNKDVEDAKIAIEEFTKKDYKLVQLNTELNPRIKTSDHYYDYEENDLNLWLANGKITTHTKLPENFQMPTTKKQLETFFKC